MYEWLFICLCPLLKTPLTERKRPPEVPHNLQVRQIVLVTRSRVESIKSQTNPPRLVQAASSCKYGPRWVLSTNSIDLAPEQWWTVSKRATNCRTRGLSEQRSPFSIPCWPSNVPGSKTWGNFHVDISSPLTLHSAIFQLPTPDHNLNWMMCHGCLGQETR